ncbi:DUF5712 family protein [Parabacteroides gordonii]|uniref:Clindamycin resistance transfer factor BtgB n=1 Tax=Parabacteroides gordonii MS-1 = DSM 23371 TaxID=1203610 RepID=A0A0F5IV97_9BACT|nr:DUF5712 family protein [Parabacteroides gordonii]KKB49453.1 hypothetical protein HMPREF1536_04517 [Parabacteroides gordonii MS-1 = DSM 23371]MCA5585721.1 DUF5712 family protein [Parabacteroides gordonii]
MHIDFAPPSNGTYNNAGSSRQLANYLEHEDLERMEKGIYTEGFFNLTDDNIYKSKVIKDIDSNIGQLLKTDAKFYAIHVSPSEKELQAMGNTEREQVDAMKRYIREVLIPEYAKNFNKELSALDIKFYGKIHFNRSRSNNELNMHCHLIVSRKDQANKKKLSPLTNHKNTKNGVIKGSFNRVNLFQQVEQGFDRLFGYNRKKIESFDYHNTMKNGSISEQLKQQEQEFQSNERKIGINQKNLLLTTLETLEARNQTLNTDTYITTNQKINNSDKQSSHQTNSQLFNSSISFFSTQSNLLSSSSISEEEKEKYKKRRKYKRR